MAAPPPASSASSVVKGDSKTRHCGPPFAGATVQCINVQSGVKVWTADVNPLAIYDPLTSTLPIKKRDLGGLPGAFTLSNVLSPEECDKFISIVETMGFEPAKVLSSIKSLSLSSSLSLSHTHTRSISLSISHPLTLSSSSSPPHSLLLLSEGHDDERGDGLELNSEQ